MYIDPDLRDRVYQLFSLEVPKLLQTIETELVTLSADRSLTKVNNLLRAAHSIKGGAASLGLVAIEDLAHQIEDIFRVLNHPELPFDSYLERLLLEIYDCLDRLIDYEITQAPVPLEFHTKTQIVLANIDDEIGHFVIAGRQTPTGLFSGIDLTQSIFEVDVAQSLARLERILIDPTCNPLTVGEFRAQAEVFIGIAQLLNLPGFSRLARATIAALDRHPHRAREVCCFALHDFYLALAAVLTNDRERCGTISPGFAFLLAEEPISTAQPANAALFVPPAELFDTDRLILTSASLATDRDEFDLEWIFEPELPTAPERMGAATEIVASAPTISSADSSLDRFDLLALFDPAPALQFDLLELFDRSIMAESLAGFEFKGGWVANNLEFDLIELFDSSTWLMPPVTDWHSQRAAIGVAVEAIVANFDRLPLVDPATFARQPQISKLARVRKSRPVAAAPQLSIRVGIERLERMNNILGELAIERHGLTIANEQVRDSLQLIREKCQRFGAIASRLQQLADSLSSVEPQRSPLSNELLSLTSELTAQFDTLELDRYSELHGIAQATTEQIAQIDEQIDDLTLFEQQSERHIDRQKQLLSFLRDDLMWARMLPIGDILSRFPRTLHELSIEYHKSVDLQIAGAGVLLDRGAIDKLLDPLLHLLRNAFDHGIDPPAVRHAAGKPERGQIAIDVYHQGSQTVIEIRDDGQGIDLARIKDKALTLGLLDANASPAQILDVIFTPGFSTSDRVTKLSGRGMGLDIVRAQLQAIKGTISIDSQLGRGTTFTLRIPLTLTIAQLTICQAGRAVYAFPADSIHRIVVPTADLLDSEGEVQFLRWQQQRIPIYHLVDLLRYSVPLPERPISPTLKATIANPADWLSPLIVIKMGERFVAIGIDLSLSEQELTIVPFGKGVTPPSYTYGCTILGDGTTIPTIDLHTLIRVTIDRPQCALFTPPVLPQVPPVSSNKLILAIDDSVTTRQSLCLSLEKFGYRTLQAKDGQEGLQLLRQHAGELKLVICDVEMPNLNGFEFLNIWRQDQQLSHIPVAMLTSRSNTKHRQLAMHLGATAYFIKPYIEQDLIAAISTLAID